jgi:hypothetical protein
MTSTWNCVTAIEAAELTRWQMDNAVRSYLGYLS